MTASLKPILAALASGRALSDGEAAEAFDILMTGGATQAQIGAFLMGLRQRGETVVELAAAATALRARALPVHAPDGAIDIVGTGGDHSGSYNVSTAAALIVAGAGVPVAKHGNRSITSKSGTADTLASLGVRIDLGPPGVEACLDRAGIAFMLAPVFHAAMRQVAGARGELGVPTIFNLTGPLINPARVTRILAGVFDRRWVGDYAEVLRILGTRRAWVVHGADGLDELTTTGPSHVAALVDGVITTFTVTPEEAGLPRARPEDLRGGDPAQNAKALTDLLDGARGPYRDIALLNAAAALVVAGKATNLAEGAVLGATSLDQGRARRALEDLVRVSNGDQP